MKNLISGLFITNIQIIQILWSYQAADCLDKEFFTRILTYIFQDNNLVELNQLILTRFDIISMLFFAVGDFNLKDEAFNNKFKKSHGKSY